MKSSEKRRVARTTSHASKLILAGALLATLLYGLWAASGLRAADSAELVRLGQLMQQAEAAAQALASVKRQHGTYMNSTAGPADIHVGKDPAHVPPSLPSTSVAPPAVARLAATSDQHPLPPVLSPSKSKRNKKPPHFTPEEIQQARTTLSKVTCLRRGQGAVLLYHTRKCAGTTLKSYLTGLAQQFRVRFMEAEGESLQRGFLVASGVLTATSLRHPIARIMSLYWYEHVAWYNEVTHEMHKCKPLSTWVDAWADGSDWKRKFSAKNPTSVYVEVQNYFVKSFSGWTAADGPASRAHLQAAKSALAQVDVVLLTEQMRAANTSALLEHNFGHPRHPQRGAGQLGGLGLLQKRSNKVDTSEVKRLEALLASDKDAVTRRLEQLNELDLELWDFAQELVARRGQLAEGYYSALGGSHGHEQADRQGTAARCRAENGTPLPAALEKHLGVFRPPGHKGPL
mmetsp:Transcript_8746/g.14883  ORF Transcript_8746/g.14883 Transcript_8746/m.14883 type:complete len:458 (+) Transcript_8746:72-1445(+)